MGIKLVRDLEKEGYWVQFEGEGTQYFMGDIDIEKFGSKASYFTVWVRSGAEYKKEKRVKKLEWV